MSESKIEMAARHVAQGRLIVLNQKQIIRRLFEKGVSTSDAENLLYLFESTLRVFEAHERQLLEEGLEPSPEPSP
jgi:hypothetical protein